MSPFDPTEWPFFPMITSFSAATLKEEIRRQPDASDNQLAKQTRTKAKRIRKLREEVWSEDNPERAAPNPDSYFISDGRGRVKIGKTEGDPKKRMATLQCGNADELTLLATDYTSEGELHRKFAHYHVRGEWFVLSEEIKQYIETL
jgi:hypothetical protein